MSDKIKQRYKHHKLRSVAFVVEFVLSALIVSIGIVFESRKTLYIILGCVCLLLSIICYFFATVFEELDAVSVLNVSCDPFEYEMIIEKYFIPQKPNRYHFMTFLNQYLGIFYCGECDRAIALMNAEIYSDSFKKQPVQWRIHAIINQCAFMLEADKDINEIKKLFCECTSLIEKISPKKAKALKLGDRLYHVKLDIALREGVYEGYEETHLNDLRSADSNFRKTTAAYSLYKYYLAVGNKEAAIRYAAIVSEFANKLYFKNEIDTFLENQKKIEENT